MTEIKINNKTYPLDWTFLSQEYMEEAAPVLQNVKGNLAKVAVMAIAAMRGGNWTFDKTPDWLLSEIGKDAAKLNELALAVSAEYDAFVNYNKPATEGNAQAPVENTGVTN